MTARHWRPRRRPTILVSLLLFLGYVFLTEPQRVEATRHEAWFTTVPPGCDRLIVAHLLVLGNHAHTDCSA